MNKFYVLLICFVTLIALFSINNVGQTFSFENYLEQVSIVADDMPSLPSTENITDTIDEYNEVQSNDSLGIVIALKYVWITLKVIYQCIVYAVTFLIFIAEFIVYIMRLIGALFTNILVWS